MKALLLLLWLFAHLAKASHTCSCYYEFPSSGPYAVTECVADTNTNATCSCPELTNPLLQTVQVPCPGKVLIQGVPGFVYDIRSLCARLTPATPTVVPKHLLPCVGAQCGGNTTGLVTFVSSVTRTLNATIPLCSFSTRTEECVDPTSCSQTCQVSDWSPWTGCTRTCGSGAQRRRTRRILRLPLGLNASSACPPLIQTMSCDTLSACNITEPTFNGTVRNCTLDEQLLSQNGTSCRVICDDPGTYSQCRFANQNVDPDLYRRCGLHALAFNGSLCACASANHVSAFSGLPCNGIRTQCDATDTIGTNVSTWVTSCASSEAMSSLTLADVYSRRREVEFRCRFNQTCPATLPQAGIRRCANVSEVNATCGLPSANASCFISCWTVSDCRGMSSECTCPAGTVRDLTQALPCRNESYVRNCTDAESTSCDGCVQFSAPGICAVGTQCQMNCSQATGSCQVIPETCGNTTTRRVQCQDADRIRYCGLSAVGCFVDATENRLTGTVETFPETITCACGPDQAIIPFVVGTPRAEQWGYGVPCASSGTLDLPCSRSQLQSACGVALGAEPNTVQWDPRFCLQRNGRVLNGTCPDDYVLRNCTDAEFYQWCPLPEHVSCRAACAQDGTCRLFGRCALQRPCQGDEPLLYCNRFATNCTLQQWDEPIVGRRNFVNRSSCTYQCEDPWHGPECQFNLNDGPCELDRWAWFCGAPWQSSNCTSLNVTTTRCTCRPNYGNPIPLRNPNQTLSVAADQLLPYCSGFKRPCNATEVPLYAGPYGASCSLYCHEVLVTDCALANYTCLPGSFPEIRDSYVQQSTDTRGPVFMPCSTNRQTLRGYDEPGLVQRVCGRGGLRVDVEAVYNGSTIQSYEPLNGTCVCINGYFPLGSVPCQSLYYTRDCTTAESALVPFELARDCPGYVCRRLCYPPRGTARELCFAHEPHPCLDNYVSPYWAQIPRSVAVEQCGPFVNTGFASCSFASDLTFSMRCSGRVRCNCLTDTGLTLAYENETTALTQQPCEEAYQVQPCVDQWEAIRLCQSVFAQNCTKRVYRTKASEAHVCGCARGFEALSSVRVCATNVSGEVCATNSKFFPPTTCGPLSFGVDYICDPGAPVLSCLSKCKCLPGAVEFFDGIPCSGYKRNCSMNERYQYCATTDAVCEMACAASHAYGGSPLPCKRLTPLPCPRLSPDPPAIPPWELERDCGPGAQTCSYNNGFRRCNRGTCRCKPWPLGALVADRCEVTTATHRPCWTDLPWLTTKPTYSCVFPPPIIIRGRPGFPDQTFQPPPICSSVPDPVATLDPLLKFPPIAIRAYCGENAQSCRMRRFFLPNWVMTFLASTAMRVISDARLSDIDFRWLFMYLNATIEPTTGTTRRVFVDPEFRCALERPRPQFTPNATVYYGQKIWCWQTRNDRLPAEIIRDVLFGPGIPGREPVINLQVNPYPSEKLWPETKSPFAFTPYPGQSFDDPFEAAFWLPECQCGGHPFSWTERDGTWHAFYDADGLSPLRPESKSAWNSYPWHNQFLDRLRCDRRHEVYENNQGICNRERRSKLTCNNMGHCRSWRHALKPLCSEYQNMYGFCLKERLLRSVYTAVEYSMLRYIPDLTFYFGSQSRADRFNAWWSTLQTRGGIDIAKATNFTTVMWSNLAQNISYAPNPEAWYNNRPPFLTDEDWRLYVGGLFTQMEMYARVQACGRGTFTRVIEDVNRCDDTLDFVSPTSFQKASCAFLATLFGVGGPCDASPPWAMSLVFGKRSNFDDTGCGAFVRDLVANRLETGAAIPEACATLLYIVQGLPWLDEQPQYAPLAYFESGNEDRFVRRYEGIFREGLSSTVDAEYLARLYHQDFKHYLRNYADGIAQGGPQPEAFQNTRLGSNVLLLQMLQKLGACKQTKVGITYTFNCTGYYEPKCIRRATTNGPCLELTNEFVSAPSFFELIMSTNVTYPRNVQLTDLKCGRNFLKVVNCGVFSNYTGSCALAFDVAAGFYRTVYQAAIDLQTIPTPASQRAIHDSARIAAPLAQNFFEPAFFRRLDDIDRTTASFKSSTGATFCGGVPCHCRVEGWTGPACDERSCGRNERCYNGFMGLCEDDIDVINGNVNVFVGRAYMIANSWDGQHVNRSCCDGGKCTLPFNWTGRVGCVNGFYDWHQGQCICDASWRRDANGRCRISMCTDSPLGCLNGGTCNPLTLRCVCAPGFYGHDCIRQLSQACLGGCGRGECIAKADGNGTECRCTTSRFAPGLELPPSRCPDPPLVGTWELDPNPPVGTCRYLDRTIFKIPRGVDVTEGFPCAVVTCEVAGNCFCSTEFVDPNRTSSSTIITVDREKLCPRSAFPFPFERDEALFNAPVPLCAAIVRLTNFSDADAFYEWRGTRCETPWAPCLNGGVPTHQPIPYFDEDRVVCVCPTGFVGQFCEWSSCPRSRTNVTCSGYDANQCSARNLDCRTFDNATNGLRCTRNGAVDFSRQGCGCTHELREDCQQPGTSSICSGIQTRGSDNQLIDTCQPYVNPSLGAIRYRCICPRGRVGQWCQNTVCPIPLALTGIITQSCNGRRCNDDGTCSCDNVGLALPLDRLLEGPNCEFDVTTACGYNPPGSTSLLSCAGHGQCVYNVSTTAFQCRCNAGYSGEFCQRSTCPVDCAFGDCVPTNNGIDSICRCWNVDVYKRGPEGACNVSDCGQARPNAAGDACVCNNTLFAPPDCTATLCHRTTAGELCGPLAAGDEVDVNSRIFADGARETIDKQCAGGQCVCGWRYRYTNNQTRCEPICHPNNTMTTLMEMDSNGRLPRDPLTGIPVLRFGSCSCKQGYTSESNCTLSKCQRGFPLNADGTCNCSAAYTGDACELSRCEGRGVVLPSGAACACNYPFVGRFCNETDPAALVCLNNGTLLNATTCNCTFPFTGRSCVDHVCQNNGEPIVGSCVCPPQWTGPTCASRVCLNGGSRASNGTCICRTQYIGEFCEQRFCGIGGNRVIINGNESLCFCSGLWTADPATGNCTVSSCVNGIPRDASSCVCNKPYVDRGGQFPNHRCRLDCEPEFGVYDEATSSCLCNDTRFGLLCEKSIVEAIQFNATTGQTHEVPLTAPNVTTTVANPPQRLAPSGFTLNTSDESETSDREPPLPTTVVPSGRPPPAPVDNGSLPEFPVGESFPIGQTTLGVASILGGSVLAGLVGLVAFVAI